MNWIQTTDNDGTICYINHEKAWLVYLQDAALKHHSDYRKILTMMEGECTDQIVKPSMDVHAASVLEIVPYLDVYAELGYNILGDTENEINIPDDYLVFDVFHAFCAKRGYYDYADYPINAFDGIRNSWYAELDFYHEGNYHAY